MSEPFPSEFLARLNPARTLPEALPPDPFPIFISWLKEAEVARKQPNPGAMTLATIEPDGSPSARIVLCRGYDAAAGFIAFFTNRRGGKGTALACHPIASAVFHWDDWERQVRITGPVVPSPDAESDAYFNRRPWEARLSAWASRQSQPLAGRGQLMVQAAEAMKDLNLSAADLLKGGNAVHIPRPPHWGGYRIWANSVELWLGGPGRFHDRARWTRVLTPSAEGFTTGAWGATRLQP